jgi:hypothetical protein
MSESPIVSSGMKFKRPHYIIFVVLSILLACGKRHDKHDDYRPFVFSPLKDTVVGHHVISTELPGGGRIKRAELFYLVIRRDTSEFCFKIRESFSGRITLDVRFNKEMTYREQLAQLEKAMPFAMNHFDIQPDYFQFVFLSRLMTMGDLAIDVSKDYDRTFAQDRKFSHQKMNHFLLHSKLAADWNHVLKQFSVQVDTVFSETLNFGDKKTLYDSNNIEADSSGVPDKLLDCIIWLRLKPKRIYSS